MNISSLTSLASRLTDLGNQLKQSRATTSDTEEKLSGQANAATQGKQGQGQGVESAPGQKRLRIQLELAREVENQEPPETAPPETEPTPPATEEPAPVTTPTELLNDDLRNLAELYVAQFEQQSGRTLSSEAEAKLVQDVYTFYSARSGGEDRLSSIVFSREA